MSDVRTSLPPVALEILAEARRAAAGDVARSVDLSRLDPVERDLIDDLLGEGEVKAVLGTEMEAWETTFAGIWRVRRADAGGNPVDDRVECGPFPGEILDRAFADARAEAAAPTGEPGNVPTARALLAEINDRIPRVAAEGNHILNLTLLPHAPEDLAHLDRALGRGRLFIRTRGYGPCEMWAAGTRNCWWVRHFDSRDAVMMEGIEIGALPESAPAAPEDLSDSAHRLAEALEACR